MTLVIALKRFLSEKEYRKRGKAELLVFADSQETIEYENGSESARKVQKVYPICSPRRHISARGKSYEYPPLAVWSGAGDSLPLIDCREICDRTLNQMFEEEWSRRPPTFEEFGKAVEKIGNELRKKLRRNINAEMILGSVDKWSGKVSLYKFSSSDWKPEGVHDEPGYAILGTGDIYGGAQLLLDLLGYELAHSWDFKLDALASFLINCASESDPHVSWFKGDGFVLRTEDRILKLCVPKKSPAEYHNQTLSRIEIMRSMWKLCDDLGNERRILEELAKLRKQLGK